MTAFQKDDTVKSRITAQGLKEGKTYQVKEVHEMPTPFGNFVTYILEGEDGRPIVIHNGHLVLERTEGGDHGSRNDR
jgi:hypothetical protein